MLEISPGSRKKRVQSHNLSSSPETPSPHFEWRDQPMHHPGSSVSGSQHTYPFSMCQGKMDTASEQG